jgi:murein DD-endopeptidase MepM/ murein hydrolase activator NlpD
MAQTVTVKQGDTLSGIASQYGVSYQEIARANNIADPNRIFPGQTFTIPDRVGTTPVSTPTAAVLSPTVTVPQVNSTPGVPPVDMSKYAGWNDQAAIQADWNNTWQSKTGGGTSGFSMPSGPAIPNFQGIYDTAIKTATDTFAPQITEAQSGVDTVNKQIADRTAALNVALGKINDNPYYSEATRVGRAAKLQQAYNNDVGLLNSQLGIASNKLSNTQNLAERAKADAQVKINIASNQYNIENAQHQQTLQQINQYLSAGMLNNASSADIAQISTSTGMSTSMVQSIINASKAKNAPQTEVKAVEDETNQYLVAYQATPEGIKILNREVVAKVAPKAATKTSQYNTDKTAMTQELQARAGGNGKIAPWDWQSALQGWLAENPGQTVDDFVRAFSKFVDTSHSADYYGYDAVFKKQPAKSATNSLKINSDLGGMK